MYPRITETEMCKSFRENLYNIMDGHKVRPRQRKMYHI